MVMRKVKCPTTLCEQNKNMLEFVPGGKYSDWQEAYNWTLQYDKMLGNMIRQEALANWNYATNISDYTAQVVRTLNYINSTK